ncbi:MAG: hypothetical protein VB108_08405 [Anaerolineaceae bacterium]|nr:hypothetical protein [Anaerolineaceae bacterium]
MNFSLSLIPAFVAVFGALFNLVRRRWLPNLISLTIQTIALFFVLLGVWAPGIALIKLIVGLAAAALISFTLRGLGMLQEEMRLEPFREGEVFRAVTGILLILLVFFFLPQVQATMFPRSPLPLLLCALCMMALSLMQLGLKAEPFHILLGLLGFLAGFELLYASLEYSALLEGFFTLVKLGLALAAPYIFALEKKAL